MEPSSSWRFHLHGDFIFMEISSSWRLHLHRSCIFVEPGFSPVLPEEFDPVLELFGRHEQLVFPEDSVFLTRERELVFLAHDNRLFGTNLFAESAENASEHVN